MFAAIKRRKREALTNYRKRVAMLKSGKKRLVIRKSNRGITAQLVEFNIKGDIVLSSASSRELKAFGWEPKANVPTAYLTGYLLAEKAKKLKDADCILDIGLYKPIKSSVVFSAAKGSADNGLPLINSIQSDESRIKGVHIAEYAKHAKGNQFAAYKKAGFDLSKIGDVFEEAKKRIKGAQITAEPKA